MKYYFLLLLFSSFFSRSQSDFYIAEKLYQQEKYNLAKPIFEEVLRKRPEHLKSLEYLGNIAANSKQWDIGLHYFEKLKSTDPKNADFQYKYAAVLSMIAQNSNKFKALSLVSDIRTSFEKAIALNPKHIEAHWALIELYLQLPVVFGGSEHTATQYANQLAILSPVDGFLAKGHIAEYFKQYSKAEEFYKKAIAIGHSRTTYQRLADLYTKKLQNHGKARAVWNEYSKKQG